MNVKFNVEPLGMLVFKDKKDSSEKVRFAYRLLGKEYLKDTNVFKGYQDLAYYFDNKTVFDKIPVSFFGKACELEFQERPSEYNPMKTFRKLISITCENQCISLL